MTPFFFGTSQAPLYGVYHAPTEPARREGVVLCYPFGQEYLRAHRAFRQLATQLSALGFHVLRFDYRGTGDSSGDMENVLPADWLEDIRSAITEIKDLAGVERITLIGLRLGALFASQVCTTGGSAHGLVVWDPIISGRGFVEELLAGLKTPAPHAALQAAPLVGEVPDQGDFVYPNGTVHFNGFDLPAAFLNELPDFDLLKGPPAEVRRILTVVSHQAPEFQRLDASWNSHRNYEHSRVDAPHDWRYANNDGAILLPHTILRVITDWMH